MQKSWNNFVTTFITNEGYKTVLGGLKASAEIALFGFLIGIFLGLIVATVKVAASKNKVLNVLSKIGDVYVALFRGTPIIVQLLIGHYVLFPLIGLHMSNLTEAIVTFGLNSGAYMSEILRGGILSVDVGQMEAGRSLGLSYVTTMLRIVFPQAFKNTLPNLGNELIALVKDTSVVSFIAVIDLTRAFQLLGSAKYDYIVPYLMLALTYLIIVLLIALVVRLVERRLRKSDARR